MRYRVLPWSRNLPAEFRKRRGMALEPLIPALVADVGPQGKRARYALWQTVGELVAESYFGQIQRWDREHNLSSGGHLLMEETLTTHVPLYGDFFRCVRRLDAPSIDCLTSVPAEVPWHIARMIGSAADLEGRTLTMSETSDFTQVYRPAGGTGYADQSAYHRAGSGWGRSLTLPGQAQSVIPWSRFQLAGWSKDPNGRLDLEGVTAISVGWGGYYGTAGERVEFRLSALQTVRLP